MSEGIQGWDKLRMKRK